MDESAISRVEKIYGNSIFSNAICQQPAANINIFGYSANEAYWQAQLVIPIKGTFM